MSGKSASHKTSFIKLVELFELLRLVTSVRLGAVRRRVQIRLWIEQRVYEKLVWNRFAAWIRF